MLLTYTGVRRNELLHIKNSDFDWEEKTIQIRVETFKSKMNRKVAIQEILIPHLQAYKFERREMKCEYFWISSNMDKRFTEHGLKHLTKKISETAKINCHVHRFRHTFAVKLYEQSKDILLVQRALGHTSIKMTLSYLRSKTDDEYIQQLLKLTAREFV